MRQDRFPGLFVRDDTRDVARKRLKWWWHRYKICKYFHRGAFTYKYSAHHQVLPRRTPRGRRPLCQLLYDVKTWLSHLLLLLPVYHYHPINKRHCHCKNKQGYVIYLAICVTATFLFLFSPSLSWVSVFSFQHAQFQFHQLQFIFSYLDEAKQDRSKSKPMREKERQGNIYTKNKYLSSNVGQHPSRRKYHRSWQRPSLHSHSLQKLSIS